MAAGWISNSRASGVASSSESARLQGRCSRSIVTHRLLVEVLGGFQPQGIDDAEAAGEQYAENPGEVPHRRQTSCFKLMSFAGRVGANSFAWGSLAWRMNSPLQAGPRLCSIQAMTVPLDVPGGHLAPHLHVAP